MNVYFIECILIFIFLLLIIYKNNILIYLFWITSLIYILININIRENYSKENFNDGPCIYKAEDGNLNFGTFFVEYGKCLTDKALKYINSSKSKKHSSKFKKSSYVSASQISDTNSPQNKQNTTENENTQENTSQDGLVNHTNCYNIGTDLQEKCVIDVSENVGLQYIINTQCGPNKARGVCNADYVNGHKIPVGDVTKCLPLTDDFNYICRDLFTDQHGIKTLDYKTCPKGYARGICETNYKNQIPLYGNSTDCKSWENNFQSECKNKYGNDYILSDKDGFNCLPYYGRGVCTKIYRDLSIDGKNIEIYNNYNCPLYLDDKSAIFSCNHNASKINVTKNGDNYILSSNINNITYYIGIDSTNSTNPIIINNDIIPDTKNLFDITKNSNGTYNIANIDLNGNYCYIDAVNNSISINKSNEYTELIFNIVG